MLTLVNLSLSPALSAPRHRATRHAPTKAPHEARRQRRLAQTTPELQPRDAARAGIEGGLSQTVHTPGLRRSRARDRAVCARSLGLAATALHRYRGPDGRAERPHTAPPLPALGRLARSPCLPLA
ncbi:MAG: hypothetical protein U0350_35650 [Caldilineaceae bacterium]